MLGDALLLARSAYSHTKPSPQVRLLGFIYANGQFDSLAAL